MSNKATPRPHPVAAFLVRRLLMPVLTRRARLTAEGLVSIRGVRPPYMVVSNHASFWDPFWLAACLRPPIQFVASDNLFRTPLLGRAMRLMGAIPKSKLVNDREAVRQVIGVLRGGGVIGIFPEGARSDDGRSAALIPSVARLVKRLGVPVIGARIMGGYLSRPRWARHSRRGPVRIAWKLLLSASDCGERSEEEILRAVQRHVGHDEMTRQRVQRTAYRARRPAEYLERLLFICPQCRSLCRLVSRDDRLRCAACEYTVRVTGLGFVEPVTGPLHFDTPADWNAWQLGVLERMLDSPSAFPRVIFEEPRARLLVGWRSRPLRPLERGAARLTREEIQFRGDSGLAWSFPIPGVQGMNVQNREKLEFYHGRALYRLDFLDPRASPSKWQKTVELLARRGAPDGTAELGTDHVRSLIRANTY